MLKGDDFMTCWFCSVREAEPKHIHGIDMYGQVGVQGSDSDTNIAYNVRHTDVPRCADCHSKHRIAKIARVMSVVFLVILAGGALSAAFSWVPDIIAGLWCGFAAGLIIACLLSSSLVQKGIKPVRRSCSEYPEVVDLLNKQYSFGLRPKEEKPRLQPPAEAPIQTSVQPPVQPQAQPPAVPVQDAEKSE